MAGATSDKGGITTEKGGGAAHMTVTGPGLGASTGPAGGGWGFGGPRGGFDFQPGKSGEAAELEAGS